MDLNTNDNAASVAGGFCRNWNILKMLLRKKLRKAYVLSTAFRKPKEIILSTPSSGNLHQTF